MARESGWGRTLVLIGILAVAGGAFVLVPPMLAPPSPSPAPSAKSSMVLETLPPTPQPPPSLVASEFRSVEWTLVPLPDPAFQPARSMVIGERVVVLGVQKGTPAGWLSDDGGTSWTAATVPPVPSTLAEAFPIVTNLASTDSVALAIGEWVDKTASTGVAPFAWTSADKGVTWRAAASAGGEETMLFAVAAMPDHFIAVGRDRSSGTVGWWASTDGRSWVQVEVQGVLAEGQIPALAAGPMGVVAVGADSDRPPRHPAAWFSADGETWVPTIFGAEEIGGLSGVVFGQGFLAAGQTGPDERTMSDRGFPMVWISPDGRAWTKSVFPDLVGGQVGSAAMNGAGAVLAIERLVSGNGQPTSTAVRFVRGGSSESSDADVPLVGVQALAMRDEFVIVGWCPLDEPEVCTGSAVAIGQPRR